MVDPETDYTGDSLAGTAIRWNYPDADPQLLHQDTLVIRPDHPYTETDINRPVN